MLLFLKKRIEQERLLFMLDLLTKLFLNLSLIHWIVKALG
ncbi:hypothetical protein AsAng_0044290 [Aureispira anguillae]|uniref:Uncharacterized protein n=1 Tax=Aureispira anguillae TaxID=2864201 RepID=A0A915YIG3_9BACT|nr:hypothetical protein AsAng_0044290 [Aureispira anguillae]